MVLAKSSFIIGLSIPHLFHYRINSSRLYNI
ncbi:hypothetical protein SVI_1250 [Shewanella violacea DSS12]|uniref:Uncharacterized protein n=1 Tax=Shewanella violacea (strain JCM 10179 / CIP 106290 / LMG 19151 / DSS12) TaxID=637905 RepID=D4ZHS2_SHEVD|nr:hypothetical protein SVI_1250 [Shewanella violacea DSS12]